MLILGVRDEYHQIHILRRKNGQNLMEDVFGVEESQRFKCFLCVCCVFVARLSQTNIIKVSSINRFESHLSISSLIMLTRVNRLEDVKHSIKVAFYLIL